MRLIATDLDGTLLRPDGSISQRNIDALRAARQAGWYVVLASGRPPFMITEFMTHLGDSVTHGVLANGSVVCTLPDVTTLRSIRFGVTMAIDVVVRLRESDSGYGFALATDAGFAHERGFAERMPSPQPVPPCDDVLVATHGANEAIKLMVFHARHTGHHLLDVVPLLLGNDLSVTHMGADCVEVGPAGIDKGAALSWLCAHLRVDAGHVVAFGDEYNDHEMLRWAGRGIAMANAHQITKELADEVTLANTQDGVAVALERILALEEPA
jgi:hydroxymethylpyrimidine pyrophosphatase-like HAD family hydrolase